MCVYSHVCTFVWRPKVDTGRFPRSLFASLLKWSLDKRQSSPIHWSGQPVCSGNSLSPPSKYWNYQRASALSRRLCGCSECKVQSLYGRHSNAEPSPNPDVLGSLVSLLIASVLPGIPLFLSNSPGHGHQKPFCQTPVSVFSRHHLTTSPSPSFTAFLLTVLQASWLGFGFFTTIVFLPVLTDFPRSLYV